MSEIPVVELYDLFPEHPVACTQIDLQKPFGDIGKADFVLPGKTIEHFLGSSLSEDC